MKFVASIAVAMRDEGAEEEPEEDNRPTVSLGFTTEIAPPIEIDLSEYFEEEDSTGRNN